MMTKPAIYPNLTLSAARARFPRCQVDLSIPRTVEETWACDLAKHRKLLALAFLHTPSVVGLLLAQVAQCADMAKIEAIWYRNAGWRE